MSKRSNGHVGHADGRDNPQHVDADQRGDHQAVSNQTASGPDSTPKFVLLVKDFDADYDGSASYPDKIDVREGDYLPEALFDRADQQHQHLDYAEWKRPWADKRHAQPPGNTDNPAVNGRSNSTPMSTWQSEAPTEEPYNVIGSVMNDRAGRPAQTSGSTMGKRGDASTQFETLGSSSRRR